MFQFSLVIEQNIWSTTTTKPFSAQANFTMAYLYSGFQIRKTAVGFSVCTSYLLVRATSSPNLSTSYKLHFMSESSVIVISMDNILFVRNKLSRTY
jgi:hypothetical protein